MIILGILNGVVELCVGIAPDQVQAMQEMYPDHSLIEQVGSETIGWSYSNGEFFAPPGVEGSINSRITKLAFINRFTDAEAIGIDLASIGETVPAATLRRALKRIDAAQYVELTDTELSNGINMLESVGLLAVGRASEILTTPPTSVEVFTG